MKKSEIATIIFVVSLSMMATFFITKSVVGDKSKLEETVKQARSIPSSLDEVSLSKQFFNKDAINPTVEVFVENEGSASDNLTTDKPDNVDIFNQQTETSATETEKANTQSTN